jgi:uncharacterized protein YhbP (UPF0306 family)
MSHVKFGHPTFPDQKINESLIAILEGTRLLSMATVNSDHSTHINTAYFAYDENLHLYIITDPKSKHAKNLARNPSVAATVFDSHQEFWTPLRGLQLFGECSKTPVLHVLKALKTFSHRFPVFSEAVKSPLDFVAKSLEVRFYTIVVKRVKVFDEPTFGEEVFIEGAN